MTLELVTLPCLEDNYAYLIHDTASGETAVIDVPDAAPILETLNTRDWTLSHVFLTHHHWDHVDGLPDLLASTRCQNVQVVGAQADAHRLPPLDLAVAEGDSFTFAGEPVEVLDVSGHTLGHIAFYLPESALAFTADSLMALGCGRLFEGTPEEMYRSLMKLAALPPETTICSGHEYTLSNAKFALTIDPGNAMLKSRTDEVIKARNLGQATVPTSLQLERDTNPFLRSHDPEIQAGLNMAGAPPERVFKEIRLRKDRF